MTDKREVKESPVKQGINEAVPYTVDFATWGSAVSSPVDALFNDKLEDVSSSHLSGSASLVGTVATSRVVSNLVKDKVYYLRISATVDTKALSCWCRIVAVWP